MTILFEVLCIVCACMESILHRLLSTVITVQVSFSCAERGRLLEKVADRLAEVWASMRHASLQVCTSMSQCLVKPLCVTHTTTLP